ncbi:MAG: T9SS type A sorting domain-containing protein [Bacteroidetes bacterium]|nr:T9SS type A sorting domain-containing protein [Bacteroidota bacterium]
MDAGNAGSSYAWSGSETTQTVTASSTGSYSVTVTDANTCSGSGSASVTINANPVVNLGGPYTQCGGSVTLDAGNAGSSYVWSGSETTQTVTASSTGSYSVTVTDANTCTGSGSASVTINDNPVVNLGGPYTQCGGSVTLDAGNAGSSYAWSGSETTQTVTASSTGSYSVTVTDANTCTGSGSASVTINANPVVNLGGPYTQCGGSVTLDAGNAGSSYAWSGSETTQTVTASSTGSYSVTVTDANTCTGSGSTSVTINTAPTATLSLPVDTLCSGTASITLSGGSPAGGVFSGANVSGGSFNPSAAGIFTIAYEFSDNNGCKDTAFADIVVEVCVGINELTSGTIELYPNPTVDNVTLKLLGIDGAIQIDLYDVTGRIVEQIADFSNASVYVRTIQVSNFASGTYVVNVKTENGTARYTLLVN